MNVEKFLDELWIGVKGQSNVVIAGSLRNSFRASLVPLTRGGRATDYSRALTGVPTIVELRIPRRCTTGVRVRGISFVLKRVTARTAG